MSALVRAEDLALGYAGGARALDGVDLEVAPGETLAVIGESGSGKTSFGMALGRVLPDGARKLSGRLEVAGLEVFEAGDADLRALRREALGFVFQNPMSALDPTMRIGRQLSRAMGRRASVSERAELLARARLDEPERLLRAWPHELSGGMAQRVVIAMAIARSPRLLVADEPTASLDASIRDKVMDTLAKLSAEAGAALVVLSHDLRLAARRADRVAVMYGGRVAEAGPAEAVFARPAHPYTAALMSAAAGSEGPDGRLEPIPGTPPTLRARCEACAFAPRCAMALEVCRTVRPEARRLEDRLVACHRAEEMLGLAPSEAAR
ncbi:MAG: ABC transporter ATP-binding protein [Pseudomonadota bacterium]